MHIENYKIMDAPVCTCVCLIHQFFSNSGSMKLEFEERSPITDFHLPTAMYQEVEPMNPIELFNGLSRSSPH